jgi:hypothetical protein
LRGSGAAEYVRVLLDLLVERPVMSKHEHAEAAVL